MKTQELSFLIQAPDNVGTNIVHVAAWVLRDADRRRPTGGAELLQRRVDEVAQHGKLIRVPEAGVRLMRWRNEFILQLDTDYHDSARRTLRVLCYGVVPDRVSLEYSSYLSSSLQKFMTSNRFPAGARLLRSAASATTCLLEDAANPRAAELIATVRKVGAFWRSGGHADVSAAREDGGTLHRADPEPEALTTVSSPGAPAASPALSSFDDHPPGAVSARERPDQTAPAAAPVESSRGEAPRGEAPSGQLTAGAEIQLVLTDDEAQALLILLDWAEREAGDRTLLAPIADRLRSQTPSAHDTTVVAGRRPTVGGS